MKKKAKSSKEQKGNPFYGLPLSEALKLIFTAGKSVKPKKKKGKGK